MHNLRAVCNCAGRNWRILRDCERRGLAPARSEGDAAAEAAAAEDTIEYDAAGHYLLAIQTHCKAACAALLDLMLHHFRLVDWLQSMKQFFLLDKADYLTVFFGLAHEDLHTVTSKVSLMRVRASLDEAIRSSCLTQNPLHERVVLSLDSPSFSQMHAVRLLHLARTCILVSVHE